MTPGREAYLAKCGKRERIVRRLLGVQKRALKQYKELLTYGYSDDADHCYSQIALLKTARQALRHELARLKGMDRVVVPSEQYDRRFETYNWYCTKCDSEISVFENYCSTCGRKILWKKASEC